MTDKFSLIILHYRFWLGASDSDSEDEWYWINEDDEKENVSFKAWLPDEPNGKTNENCLMMTKSGDWIDLTCKHDGVPLCQVLQKRE